MYKYTFKIFKNVSILLLIFLILHFKIWHFPTKNTAVCYVIHKPQYADVIVVTD